MANLGPLLDCGGTYRTREKEFRLCGLERMYVRNNMYCTVIDGSRVTTHPERG